MTANRVYRAKMDFGYVLGELEKGRGTQFDPQFVDVLLKLIRDGVIDLNTLYGTNTEQQEGKKEEPKPEEAKAGEKKEEPKKEEPKPGTNGDAGKQEG
jgi:energy-coupling factor transport system substrate-specific component